MKKLVFAFLLVTSFLAFGQEIKRVSGNFDFLKGQSEIDVEMKFSNVLFLAENISESEYLERRKKDVLDNPKRGEEAWIKWIGEWEKYKNTEYLNFFLKGLNKKSKNLKFSQGSGAKYKLIFETEWVFPGWNGGFVYQQAKISGKAKYYDANDLSNPLAVIEVKEYDDLKPNSEIVMEYGRIAGGYEALGYKIAWEMRRPNK